MNALIEQYLPEVAIRAKENCGFLSKDDCNAIAAHPATRLVLLLVRCGNGRFLCPAQNLDHFINIITRDHASGALDSDYVRDVSVPA